MDAGAKVMIWTTVAFMALMAGVLALIFAFG